MSRTNGPSNKLEIYSGRGTVVLVRLMSLDAITKNYGAELVFKDLVEVENMVQSKIIAEGGLIDGNLKTGFNAFFGWDSNQTSDPLSHVRIAFDCAQDLQKAAARTIRNSSKIRHPLFLLQIAIATDFYNVCRKFADLSQHDGIIGEGHGLAQRIIEYCGIKSVILTAETERILQHMGPPAAQRHEIKIRLPNSSKVISAYEYNSFGDDPESYRIATNRIRASINRRSDLERWSCVQGNVNVEINGETYRLLNISRGGLEIEGKSPHINGHLIDVSFDKPGASLRICAEKLDLAEITCEVRWNKKKQDHYNIGLMFIGLDQARKDELISLILSNSQKRSVAS